MDSRLIVGAYSQHFPALEKEAQIYDSDRIDSLARAKRLSQETNKRRKIQAQRRKLEAKREERRRQEILTKRREEQKLATEKYQRSHLPPSARQSNRRHSARLHSGLALEDALRLIRGSPWHERARSAQERVFVQGNENKNPMEKSYFDKPGHYYSHPPSTRTTHQLDANARTKLMDVSMQNLTTCKTLFEQQLEQQQSLLLEQQQQSLREFNNAVRQELEGSNFPGELDGNNFEDGDADDSSGNITHCESCSSLDSLEASYESERLPQTKSSLPTVVHYQEQSVNHQEKSVHHQKQLGHIQEQSVHHQTQSVHHQKQSVHDQEQSVGSYHSHGSDQTPVQNDRDSLTQQALLQGQSPKQEDCNASSNQKNEYHLLNRDLTAVTLCQKEASSLGMQGADVGPLPGTPDNTNNRQRHNHPYVGLTRRDILGTNNQKAKGDLQVSAAKDLEHTEKKFHVPIKQFSTDSLESCSSISNLSVVKGSGENMGTGSQREQSQEDVSGQNQITHKPKVNGFRALSQQCSGQDTLGHHIVTATGATSNTPTQAQMVWVSPSVQLYPAVPEINPTPSNKAELVTENFNPRYASAISSAIWPGHASQNQNQIPISVMNTLLVNNTLSYNSRMTLTAATATTSHSALSSAKSVPNSSSYSTAGVKTDPILKGTSESDYPTVNPAFTTLNSTINDFSLNKHDLICDYQYRQPLHPELHQKPGQPLLNYQTNALNNQNVYLDGSTVVATNQHTALPQQINFQHLPNGSDIVPLSHQPISLPAMLSLSQQTGQQCPYKNVAAHTVPIPVTRTVLPLSRPPSPVEMTPAVETMTQTSATVTQQLETSVVTNTLITVPLKNGTAIPNKDGDENETDIENEEDKPPLKGILKQFSHKPVPMGQVKTVQGKPHPRDSLELARVQNDKKGKKKSVHFADPQTEEADDDDTEEDETSGTSNIVVPTTGMPFYKSALNRPVSAKSTSVAPKVDSGPRVQRTASAGTVRLQVVSDQTAFRHFQEPSFNSSDTPSGAFSHKSNLPSSFVSPLNTTPSIHRPKAAAHIIMSTEAHHIDKVSNGYNSHAQMNTTTVTSHNSQVETKTKTISNNFMSKVPIKVPTSGNTNALVYHVAQIENGNSFNDTMNRNGNNKGNDNICQDVTQDLQQQVSDKSKPSYSAAKRAAISNSATKTSMAPTSTKSTHTQSNSGAPSYSVSTRGLLTDIVYDENGLRIDRTPTDDEITWLWDKVRNCLSKENTRNPQGGYANGGQGSKQPSVLSTKLIDGASLGVGANANNVGMNGLKSASGVFHPWSTTANSALNKVKPGLQQQGSYLKRFGLLKQRRAVSASPAGGNRIQRVNSPVFGRPSGVPTPPSTTAVTQGQQQEGPTPMALAYKPHDEVSESTAAFLMAERLAKQSLSDSHIEMAMEDAKMKQEVHNRAKMLTNRGGPSALSLEEQRLLESLDKLNEKLKVTDPNYNGTIQYHQPYQAHVLGFRGHTPMIDTRRHNLTSPRIEPRAQSARYRQHTRQYR